MSTSRPAWIDLRRQLARAGRWALLAFLEQHTSYESLPHQRRFHLAAPVDLESIINKLLLGGVGAGKTWAGAAEDIMLAIANPGCWGVILAPTRDQVWHVLMPVFRLLADELAAAGYPLVRKWRIADKCAELVCGGRVYFRSFDNVDAVRGFSFAWGHLDETEMHRRPWYAYETMSGRIRQAGAHIRQIHATTTPRGAGWGVVGKFVEQRNLADGMSAREARAKLSEWWAGVAPTKANTHLPKGYERNLRAGMSKRQAEQELEAKLLRPDLAVWPEFSRDTHLAAFAYDPERPYDLAVDWGDQFPHALFIQQNAEGSAVVFAEFCDDNVPTDHLKARLLKATRVLQRPPTRVVGDRAVKKMNAWARDTFPASHVVTMVSRQEQSVTEGVETVRSLLDPFDGEARLFVAAHLADDPPKRGIVRCLENYRYLRNRSGGISSRPWKDNIHDHGSDALRMWAVAASEDLSVSYSHRSHGQRADDYRRRLKKALAA